MGCSRLAGERVREGESALAPSGRLGVERFEIQTRAPAVGAKAERLDLAPQ
jgi:hypothetical protein